MNLVVDANILFSALIKDGTTRRIFFENSVILLAPEFIVEEFEKYKEELFEKAKMSQKEFDEVILVLKRRIIIKPICDSYLENAKLFSPDINDSKYFALAMELNIPIWSNDNLLKNQHIIKIINTKELFELIYY